MAVCLNRGAHGSVSLQRCPWQCVFTEVPMAVCLYRGVHGSVSLQRCLWQCVFTELPMVVCLQKLAPIAMGLHTVDVIPLVDCNQMLAL